MKLQFLLSVLTLIIKVDVLDLVEAPFTNSPCLAGENSIMGFLCIMMTSGAYLYSCSTAEGLKNVDVVCFPRFVSTWSIYNQEMCLQFSL